MSGLAGIITQTSDIEKQTITQMKEAMRRRGNHLQQYVYEDSKACFVYTHSPVQSKLNHITTMVYQNMTYVIMLDGELYNKSELKQELKRVTHVITEDTNEAIILLSFIVWKENCVKRLNGIFAFSIWIKELQQLFLARDCMGVKPLCYVAKRHFFMFASEIKTLLTHSDVTSDINANGLMEIMMLGPGKTPGYAVFHDIKELKKGQYAYYSEGELQVHSYYQLRDRYVEEAFGNVKQMTRILVEDAIQRQLQASVNCAAFLSGGLDSSIICAIASEYYKKRGKQLTTYSVSFEDNEKYVQATKYQPTHDAYYVDTMQKFLGSKHHTIQVSIQALADSLYQAVDARDLPGMADIDSSLLLLCENVKDHIDVILSGECADEIFGGYPWYYDQSLRNTKGFPWNLSQQYRKSFLRDDLLQALNVDRYVEERYQNSMKEVTRLPHLSKEEKRIREIEHLTIHWFMQSLLERQDRMSMYHDLEIRVPFCDMRIVDYMYSIPWQYKNHGGKEKGLLREAMKELLPESILWRKKSPYPKTWHPRYREIVSKRLEALIADPQSPLLAFVKKEALNQLLKEDQSIPWYGQLMNTPQTIAYFLQVNYWLQTYQVHVHI